MTSMDEADHFFLRWDNFHTNLVEGFQSLLDVGDLLDVTLVAENQQMQAHKVVLSAYSSYFRSIFKANPCRHPVIILKDVNPKDLTAILHFMYRGEAVIRRGELKPFLQTARTLNIKGLIEHDSPTNAPRAANEDGAVSERTNTATINGIPVRVTESDDQDSECSEWSSSGPGSPDPMVSEHTSELMHNPVSNTDDDALNPVHFVPVQEMLDEANNAEDSGGEEDEQETAVEESPDRDTKPVQGTSAVFSAAGLSSVAQGSPTRAAPKSPVKRVGRRPSKESFQCPVCEKSFLLKSSLRMHVTVSHKGVTKGIKRPYVAKSLKTAGESSALQRRKALLAQESLPTSNESLKQKRVKNPVLHLDSDFLTSDTGMERCQKITERKDPLVIAPQKRKTVKHNMASFVNISPLTLKDINGKVVKGRKQDCSPVACSSQAKLKIVNVNGQFVDPGPFISAASSSVSVDTSNNENFESELEKLRDEIRTWGELASQPSGIDELKQEIQLMTSRLKNVEECIHKTKVPKQSVVSLATSAISSITTSSNAEPRHLDVEGDKVLLGDGIKCSVSSYQTLLHTKSKQDWCGALLFGVFGNMAKNYRYNIQKKNEGKLLRFPREFNNVAKVMYSQFLQRIKPLEKITDKDVKSVFSLLSMKARDMNGRRNKSSKIVETIELVVDPNLVVTDTCHFEDDGKEVLLFEMEDEGDIVMSETDCV